MVSAYDHERKCIQKVSESLGHRRGDVLDLLNVLRFESLALVDMKVYIEPDAQVIHVITVLF